MMWIDTTLMGLMSGVQAMVGRERFALAQQSEGRRSVEADWQVISRFPDFRRGFDAIARIAGVAGWGVWKLVSLDAEAGKCRFRVWNSWEGRYQKALGVCWGSGMLAGKLAGYCSNLFGRNCWATQTSFIAEGDEFDEFEVAPSERTIENELANLLATDHATRADMAVALEKLRSEVAERERAEAALRESEERYRAIVEDQTELIFRNLPDGTITFVNEAYCRCFGLTSEELLGRRLVSLVPEGDRRKAEEYFASFGPEDPVATLEHRIRLPNGETCWHQWTIRAIFDDANRIAEFQGAGRDITDRKRAEEEKAKLEDQLRQSQKLEAIGRLAGGVAHDFNNILTGIIGYAELIIASLRRQDPLRAEVEEIRQAGERAASLTNQLLAFSRKQLIDPKVIRLNEIMDGSQRMLGRIIGEDIDLVFSCADSLWRIKADPAQVDQILVNLAVNARDAMPDGGRLSVEAANVTVDAAHCQGQPEMTPGDYVMLVVSDTGHGMDEETMGHVFEPFFSTKRADKGTGLGLATVYGIVRQNEGFIEVHSEIGAGTSFKIYFPRALGEADDLRAADVLGRLTGSETILLVEDEGMVRSLASKILTRYGYTVLEADGSGRALEIGSGYPRELHLLVTDVVMPGMNGKELYGRLKERRPNLRALFMSGYTDDVIAHHGVLERQMQFIQKPFSIEFLVKKVRDVLDG